MTSTDRVVIAPDSFKGTATATEVARALAAGWASVRPADELVLLPMADGGEGTLDAFELAVPGARRMPVLVVGPDDRAVRSHWLLLPDGTGVVELACTSGITLLAELRPLDAHTVGFGEAIADALRHGVDRLYLALGGSASTDGGAGALTALGAVLLDDAGRPLPPGGRGLAEVAAVDLAGLPALPPGGALVLSDVTNPLLGAAGAAAVFGPQKGADAGQVAVLEAGLARWAGLLGSVRGAGGAGVAGSAGLGSAGFASAGAPGVDPATPGAGAAGGAAFGLLAWGARLAAGSAAVGEALGVPAGVAGASVVITGEGRFDAQSAAGKVPSYLAGLAADAGARALLVAGAIDATALAADPGRFAHAVSLTDLAGGSAAAMADPLVWLEVAGARLARGA
ncbi:glycerate kinase [Cryobacterium sp. 1639]|uniref:glycerate kinase n=1 Tax=Cryobacterium inferilacus TaxID=2866629 RepID=UPI001C72A6FC|nr:glycerate kinase [Cryobacterium sp. 1639]MBX0300883.1 glycerate kinase [Cryobacterium sp. 1639]